MLHGGAGKKRFGEVLGFMRVNVISNNILSII